MYIPFAGGGCGEIKVDRTDQPAENLERLINLVYVDNFNPDVKRSFRLAAMSAEGLLGRKGLWKRGDRYEFLCEVNDPQGNSLAGNMTGGSGSLACALALACDLGGKNTTSVAATGEISDAIKGRIGPVAGLDAKLKGAISEFPSASIIFYPRANKNDVTDEILARAKNIQVELKAVSTLEEAAKHLGLLKKGLSRLWLAAAVLVAAIILGISWYCSSFPLAVRLLERGQYGLAECHLNLTTWVFPWHNRLMGLLNALNEPLRTEVKFKYLLQSGEEGFYLIKEMPKGMVLASSDMYSFHITPSAPLYLYIYEIDSLGEIRIMFPCAQFASYANPLEPEGSKRGYALPQGGMRLFPKGYKGVVKINIVASRWRCRDLEELLTSMESRTIITSRHKRLEKMIEKRDRAGSGAFVKRVVYWGK